LHVSDIAIPGGVELETDLDATVVGGLPPRVQVVAAETTEVTEEAAEPVASDTEEA
jgi:large subunit ribosomal protein L25